LIAIAALLLGQAAMPSTYNGVWISTEGFAFTVASPFTVWATIDHRHFSAYQLVTSPSGFRGLFDSSRQLKPGYSPDAQIQAQYDLLSDSTSKFPTDHLDVPLELPCVPAPDKPKTADFGTVEVKNATDRSMHMSWTNAQGQVQYSGDVAKVGGDEVIEITGSYVDRDIVISMADVGKGPKHTLVGTVKLSGVTYRLKGLRVWGRGEITLMPQTRDEVVGTGWVEWDPSTKFSLAIKSSKPQPSDQILAYVALTDNGFTTGATHRLTRLPGQ
jgi:hypothetical protein